MVILEETNVEIILLLFVLNLVRTPITIQQTRKWKTLVPHCMQSLYVFAVADVILGSRASYAHALSPWKES